MRGARSRRWYWRERLEVAVKAVAAAVLAWLAARYVLGHEQPYFAPLAALLGVYPTVARSVRESLAYAAGFLLGALLAIPVGVVLGPNAWGIAAVLVFALLVAGWRWLGEQASQVAFTGLFALLMGGHEVVAYVLPRLADVAVGLAFGLAVNAVVFPPVRLRRAEFVLLELRDELAVAMEHLAGAVTEEDGRWSRWRELDRRLEAGRRRARRAYDHGRDSLRGNPRARLRGYRRRWRDLPGSWPAPRLMNTLERAVASLGTLAGTVREAEREAAEVGAGRIGFHRAFREEYARLLRHLAGLVRALPAEPSREALDEADRIQRRLEEPHKGPGTDAPGLWDPQKELLRLSRLMLDDVCSP
ncbi:FUSC family protein [Spirillospora sp. CA-255316]